MKLKGLHRTRETCLLPGAFFGPIVPGVSIPSLACLLMGALPSAQIALVRCTFVAVYIS